MRKLVIFICLCIFLTGCKNRNRTENLSVYYEQLPWEIQNTIRDFYYSYFRYPETTDELINYLWEWINRINDFKYNSYIEFKEDTNDSKIPPPERLIIIDYLLGNKKDISIIQKENSCIFYSKELYAIVEVDICEEKNDFMSKYRRSRSPVNFYDVDCKLIRIDYEPEFSEGLKNVTERYPQMVYASYKGSDVPLHMIFSYQPDKELISLCEPIPQEGEAFFQELEKYCTDFIDLHDEIHSLIFRTIIYKE